MASVELKDLTKSFGRLKVLDKLNLSIDDGEFVALVGPSGCGKSTLLRLIAGLDDPSGGEVLMDNQWVNDQSPRERNVAMVFQSYALYPHMTVAENIGFNLRISGVNKAEIKTRVAEAADILDLGELLKRKPSQLSGGQRQRVAMGRALVRNPDVFLFDEPLSNLDAKLRVQMREEIRHLHQKVRTTSIYVTHDQIEAMTLADRIVILNAGEIQQIGTPTELYKNPSNQFVAGFIGSPAMNFVPCTINTNDGIKTLTLNDGSILKPAPDKPIPNAGAAMVGLRPEHLRLTSGIIGDNTVTGTVEVIEPTGAQNHLKIASMGSVLTVVDSNLIELAVGDTVQLTIAPDSLHVFSTESLN